MNEPANREVVVLNAALELPPEQRVAFLDSACTGDVALRRRVEVLIEAHEQAGTFLDQSPEEFAFPRKPVLPVEKPGDKIGRYKLLQQIGEGGCGVVYMAEQEEPVRRRVALKVIKLGMDTRQVMARFDAERQALALMDHPNIAKVLDAGATETGRPYFVMELVRGIKITGFCDENKLTTEERLELFIQVCHAVQHAHQKGIIHRDLKPSNILVTVNDGVAVPKVIDFGIAKATEGRLTDQTLFTAFEQFLGTPAYMSPEQAVMTSADIDTRSDIYSLGVLLYELLTGNTPFDQKELLAAGLDEMRRTIREREPLKPSTRLSTMLAAERTTAAQLRQTDVPRLIHRVRGDLDWIVMKCLEKDRVRRYETANGLAMDIQRHLSCEPVVARPPSKLYEFQKTVRRHKFGFGATAVVILVLMTGVAVSSWLAIRATRAEKEQIRLRREEEAEKSRAQTEAERSRQVSQFLKDMLKGVGPSVALGRDTTMLREILAKTSQRVTNDLQRQPEIEAEMLDVLGEVYLDLGQAQTAEELFRKALKIRRSLVGAEHPSVAITLQHVGNALSLQGRYHEAVTTHREALAMWRKLAAPESREVAGSLNDLGDVLLIEGNKAEAESVLREALSIRRELLGEESLEVADSLESLGLTLRGLSKLEEAEQMLREALAIQRQLLGNEHPAVADTLDDLGWLAYRRNRPIEAEQLMREELSIVRKIYDKDHPRVGTTLNNFSIVLDHLGKISEADSLSQEAVANTRKRGDHHPELYTALLTRGSVLLHQNRLGEAESVLREAHQFEDSIAKDEVLDSGRRLADVLQRQGKLDEAKKLAELWLQKCKQRIPYNWRSFDAKSFLGGILLDQTDYAEAEPLLIAGYQGLKQREGDIPWYRFGIVTNAATRLVKFYEATGNAEQVVAWRKIEAEVRRKMEEVEQTDADTIDVK